MTACESPIGGDMQQLSLDPLYHLRYLFPTHWPVQLVSALANLCICERKEIGSSSCYSWKSFENVARKRKRKKKTYLHRASNLNIWPVHIQLWLGSSRPVLNFLLRSLARYFSLAGELLQTPFFSVDPSIGPPSSKESSLIGIRVVGV